MSASSASRALDERDQTLCAHLLDEIAGLESEDVASRWALVRFRAKLALSRPYAARVEESFSARLSQLAADRGVEAEAEAGAQPDALRLAEESPGEPAPNSFAAPPLLAAQETLLAMTTLSDPAAGRSDGAPTSAPSDRKLAMAAAVESRPSRSAVASKPARLRDPEHLRFVAGEPCLVCGRTPADPHHLRYLQPRALGRKVSDEFTVPLCRGHHRELHRMGDERQWWRERAIDPEPTALALWRRSHGDPSPRPPQEPTAPPALSPDVVPALSIGEPGRQLTT